MLGTVSDPARVFDLPRLSTTEETGAVQAVLTVSRPVEAVLSLLILDPGEFWEMLLENGDGEGHFEALVKVDGGASLGANSSQPTMHAFSLSKKLGSHVRVTLMGQGGAVVAGSLVCWAYRNTWSLPPESLVNGITPKQV